MLRLIYAFVEIALHRRGPDRLPRAPFLFWLTLFVSVAVSLFVAQFATIPPDRVVPMVAVDTGLTVGFAWAVLKAFGVERRFLQTASALLGTSAFLKLLELPFVLWHRALHVPVDQPTIPYVIYLVIALGWWNDVAAFVISRAIERPYVLGLAVVVGYALFALSVDVTLFSTPK
ncbi:MAG TPA: hypothetical protein VL131_16625 [Gammaproteobacteria bacterium]|nr:hypothetical protein [Gammaproteobacteria bacterium]